jgi:hypothetical protein
MAQQPPSGPGPPHCHGFMITLRHCTLGRTPLDEWSAHRRDLYLTTHNTHNGQTSTPPAGFEPTISASERPQTHALDGAATGIDDEWYDRQEIFNYINLSGMRRSPLLYISHPLNRNSLSQGGKIWSSKRNSFFLIKSPLSLKLPGCVAPCWKIFIRSTDAIDWVACLREIPGSILDPYMD